MPIEHLLIILSLLFIGCSSHSEKEEIPEGDIDDIRLDEEFARLSQSILGGCFEGQNRFSLKNDRLKKFIIEELGLEFYSINHGRRRGVYLLVDRINQKIYSDLNGLPNHAVNGGRKMYNYIAERFTGNNSTEDFLARVPIREYYPLPSSYSFRHGLEAYLNGTYRDSLPSKEVLSILLDSYFTGWSGGMYRIEGEEELLDYFESIVHDALRDGEENLSEEEKWRLYLFVDEVNFLLSELKIAENSGYEVFMYRRNNVANIYYSTFLYAPLCSREIPFRGGYNYSYSLKFKTIFSPL